MALLQDYNKLFEHTDNINKIYVNNNVVWPTVISSTPPGPDYTEPFYVENISNTTETLSIKKDTTNAPTLNVQYSLDRTNWKNLCTTYTVAYNYTLQPGDKVYLRCNTNLGWGSSGTSSYHNSINGCSKVGGNIMSLLYGSSFTGKTTFRNSTYQAFRGLFDSNNILEDAKNLLLPATTLVSGCYRYMFNNCTNLKTAPELPATTLATYCYSIMFYGCSSLITAPDLPATTLVEYCYDRMFTKCTSLTTAPELPAATLTTNCYYQMFRYCSLLNTVKCLATDRSASNATSSWLGSVSSTGTFTKAAGVTWRTGLSGIPSGWTVIEV